MDYKIGLEIIRKFIKKMYKKYLKMGRI